MRQEESCTSRLNTEQRQMKKKAMTMKIQALILAKDRKERTGNVAYISIIPHQSCDAVQSKRLANKR